MAELNPLTDPQANSGARGLIVGVATLVSIFNPALGLVAMKVAGALYAILAGAKPFLPPKVAEKID